jgi:hypothetical protein
MNEEFRASIERLRSVRALDAEGNRIEGVGAFGFGTEPNPDAADGTYVGVVTDVTTPDNA